LEQGVGALDSGEDLRMHPRSWEDDSRSWRLCWQRQRNLVISTNIPNSGNPEDAILWQSMIRGLQTWIKNLRLRDSGEDLQMHSRSWEDDSRSWQLSWQRQHDLVISTNTPDGGNSEGAF